MKVGVFDSGVGGQAIVSAIKNALPELEVTYAEDRKNVPYGTKPPDRLKKLVVPILKRLNQQGCDAVVIACNTVTTTIIEDLRAQSPVPLIGMEPMIKPAAQLTKTRTIAVCATPTTLKSARYEWLKSAYAQGVTVLEPECGDWAGMIESSQIDHDKIENRISEVCQRGADVIVLGCTHYHWIETDIQKVAGQYGAKVIQPEQAMVGRLKQVLARLA